MIFQSQIMTSGGNLMAVIDNQVYQVTKEHPLYKRLFEAYRDKDADAFLKWYDQEQSLEEYVNTSPAAVSGGVTVQGSDVFYQGKKLQNVIVDTINNMMQHGLDFDPMVKFLERAIKSNSKRVVEELFRFIEACGLTITEDGCFLAYKTVAPDYWDKYSRTVLNTVGAHIERKERWEVDDDCNRTCSTGYHVGALAYAGPGGTYNSYNDHVMICKVAPEDVVSVPTDYSGQKLRCCWYEVVGEFKQALKPTVYSGRVGDSYDEPVAQRVLMTVEPEEMVVDGMYTAWYDSQSGHSDYRFFVVTEVGKNHVLVELMQPEEEAGKTRRFNFDNFGVIYEWDGDPQNAPEYYGQDEDEDEDCCNCGCCDTDDDDDYDDDDDDSEYQRYW
jgi:hypothetical protein